MSDEKAYPADPLGLEDHADHVSAKPCAARLERSNGPQTWCGLPDGHEGTHAGVVVRPIATNEFGPADAKRRRW